MQRSLKKNIFSLQLHYHAYLTISTPPSLQTYISSLAKIGYQLTLTQSEYRIKSLIHPIIETSDDASLNKSRTPCSVLSSNQILYHARFTLHNSFSCLKVAPRDCHYTETPKWTNQIYIEETTATHQWKVASPVEKVL